MSQRGPIVLMELYIETLTGVLMELMVHPFETIYNIKAKISRLEGFPISEQHLIWQATELDNEMSLHYYRIPDGATLRLVLNMRGGPVNTKRVPLEESSLREMAEYFSEPVGDDHSSGDRPVTVIVYQQGEHINFFRLVDRDASSSLSYSLSGGSDFHGEDDSPIPKERQEENDRTRDKMKMLKAQMENLSLMKEKKQSLKRNHVPRPPSSGRPQSRTKPRTFSKASSKQTGILNKNVPLPPVGQTLSLPSQTETNRQASEDVTQKRVSTGSLLQCNETQSSETLPVHEQKPAGSSNELEHEHSALAQASLPQDKPLDISIPADATEPVKVSSDVNADSVCSLPTAEETALRSTSSDLASSKLISQTHGEKNNCHVSTFGTNDDAKDVVAAVDSHQHKKKLNLSDPLSIDSGDNISHADEMHRSSSNQTVDNTWHPNSTKGSRTVANQILPPLLSSQYLPFPPPSSGHLQQQHSSQASQNGYSDNSLPAEAVLGYLMSPTRRTGVERKTGGMTLQSLNQREVRAVSGMLRKIVRSASRSQPGYIVSSGKLRQVPTSPTVGPSVPFADPSSVIRVLSSSREGRATPVRVRLPSVKVTKKKSSKRCALCKKRTKLATGFQCRCGENFCLTHLCAEAHGCTYDYKAEGRKLIEQNNPVVTAPKLPKI